MSTINRLYFFVRHYLAKNFPILFTFCEKHKTIAKFFIAGTLSSVVDLLALFLFHGIFHWEIVISTSIAFLLSLFVSFSLQKLWTFRNYSHERLPHQLFLYFAAAFIVMNLNGIGMHIFVNNFHIWYILSQIIVNLVLGVINFFAYKFIIFRPIKNEA